MLNIGDYAVHKTTGHSGKVLGYGLRIVNGVHRPTLRVRVTTRKNRGRGSCLEDVASAWAELRPTQPAMRWQSPERPEHMF
jgi:hypothetical protein